MANELMKFPFYQGTGLPPADNRPSNIPTTSVFRRSDPAAYLPDAGLADAVNVALLLGQPLLLTGEPGTGKTQLAYSVAWELGLGEPLKFETKSTTVARDLFYIYDAVGRFHAAQTGQGSQRSVDYIEYNALGKAILFTLAPADVASFVPPGFSHPGTRRSVVLIDEVDKAPRDFPNDILNELEGLYFRVPELGNAEILADRELPPIVIVTSNSEKHLPEPFLRRCIFYHISFPDERRMREIALAHLADGLQDRTEFLAAALSLFYELRKPGTGLRKKPATAEFLNWVYALHQIASQDANPLAGSRDRVLQTLGSLAKTPADQETAQRTIVQWMATRNP